MKTKTSLLVLYSPGFGSGWSSWEDDDGAKRFMLTHKPTIDAIMSHDENENPSWERFESDFREAFPNKDIPYNGGFDDLAVYRVNGPFRIAEYDGSESVVEFDDRDYFDLAEF